MKPVGLDRTTSFGCGTAKSGSHGSVQTVAHYFQLEQAKLPLRKLSEMLATGLLIKLPSGTLGAKQMQGSDT